MYLLESLKRDVLHRSLQSCSDKSISNRWWQRSLLFYKTLALAEGTIAAAAAELLYRLICLHTSGNIACFVYLSICAMSIKQKSPKVSKNGKDSFRNPRSQSSRVVRCPRTTRFPSFRRIKLSMTERTDEERSLMGDQKKSYGVHSSSGQLPGVRLSWRQTPSGYSSRAGSDNEDDESSLHHPPRHKRPPLSTLSSFMNTRHSDTPNLVLPALDPR